MGTSPISINLNGATSTSGTNNGLGQGIDVNAAVNQIITADRAPEQVWLKEQTDLVNQGAALIAINGDLSAFSDSVNALKDPVGALAAKVAGSSNPSVLTASAQTSAVPGSHVVVINNLATISSAYTDPVSTGSTLGSGSITLQVGSGAVQTITIGPTSNTLSTLASYINGQSLGVSANVISDASGQRLALVSNISGQPGNLTVVPSGSAGTASYNGVGDGTITGLAGGTASKNETITLTATDATHFSVNGSVSGSLGTATVGTTFTSNNISFAINAGNTDFQAGDAFTVPTAAPPLSFHQIAGVNASLSVDGIPVNASSNIVSNVIPGVTLNIQGDGGHSQVQLNVAPDISQASQAIGTFVSAYNKLIGDINVQFAAPANGSAAPSLEANGSLRLLQGSLLTGVSQAVSGNSRFVNLASLGVNVANDGTLSVDSAQLNDAINNHSSDFVNFFQSLDPNNTGFARTLSGNLASLTDPTQGLLNLELAQNTATQTYLTGQINDFEDRLAVTQQDLIRQYSQINVALQQLPLLQNRIAAELGALPSR
jgi:flagellar hook-associated protein 2